MEDRETEDVVRQKLQGGVYVTRVRPKGNGSGSPAWKVFDMIHNNATQDRVGFVVCSKCPDFKHILKFKEGSGTSTMMRHIQGKHPTDNPRRACTAQAKSKMLEACVYYVGRDKAPFFTLEKKGMRRLLQTAIDIGATCGNVDIDELMSHRTTVANHVDQEAAKIRETMKPDLLEAIGTVGSGGTIDLWTCQHTHIHMLSFTLSYVTKLFELENHNLLMIQFVGAETADRVKEAVVSHLQRYYGIPPEEGKKIVMTSDGGQNVVNAMQAFADTWLYCLDHGLNVCVRGSLELKYHDLICSACLETPRASALIGAVREAVSMVKGDARRTQAVARLKKALVSPKPWNSFTTMLLSVRAYFPQVKQYVASVERGGLLDGVSEGALDDLVTFLSVFDYDGEREKSPEVTPAKVPALLKHCEDEEGDSQILIEMKERARIELQLMPIVDQVSKCKELVTFFKRSGLMPKLSKSLKQEIVVRWNSILTSLKSIDEMWDEVVNVLRDAGKSERMAGISREVVRLLIRFYTPFKEESLKLEGEKYPTLPLALPAIVRLKAHCGQELRTRNSEDEPAEPEDVAFTLVRKKVLRLITEKINVGLTYRIGAFFHPRFRLLQRLAASEREETYAAIRRMIGECEGETDTDPDQPPIPPAKRSKLDEGYDDWDSWEDAAPVAEGEVTRYLREATSKEVTTETLLNWWKTEGSAYPKLQRLSRKYLAITATSANSERSFSGVGYILDDKGTRTAPETLGSIMFLNGVYRSKEGQS